MHSLLHTQSVLVAANNEGDTARARAEDELGVVKGKLKTQKENMRHLAREHARQEELIESYRALLHTLNPKAARRADIQTGRESAADRRKRIRRKKSRIMRKQQQRESVDDEDKSEAGAGQVDILGPSSSKVEYAEFDKIDDSSTPTGEKSVDYIAYDNDYLVIDIHDLAQ